MFVALEIKNLPSLPPFFHYMFIMVQWNRRLNKNWSRWGKSQGSACTPLTFCAWMPFSVWDWRWEATIKIAGRMYFGMKLETVGSFWATLNHKHVSTFTAPGKERVAPPQHLGAGIAPPDRDKCHCKPSVQVLWVGGRWGSPIAGPATFLGEREQMTGSKGCRSHFHTTIPMRARQLRIRLIIFSN